MNKETQDKLDWLMNQKVDPKRSQIHSFVIDATADFYDLFWLERYATVYYDELAEWIEDLDEEKLITNKDDIEQLVDFIYEDATKNNMWGFVYDW